MATEAYRTFSEFEYYLMFLSGIRLTSIIKLYLLLLIKIIIIIVFKGVETAGEHNFYLYI